MNRHVRYFIGMVLVLALPQFSPARGVRTGTTATQLFPWAFAKFGVQAWSTGGAGVAMDGVAGSAFSNPAALDAQSLSLFVEAGKRLPVDWNSTERSDGQWIVPAFISLDIPGAGWNASAGYANFYNSYFLLSVPETTPEFPEGTGRTIDFESSIQTHTAFGAVGYRVSRTLSVGLTAGVNAVRFSENVAGISASGTGFGVLFIPGIFFKPSPSLSVGIAGTFASTVDADMRFISETYIYSLPFPWKMDGGVAWHVSPIADLVAGLTFQRWSSASSDLVDRFQVHLGGDVAVSSDLIVRAGFFTQSDPTPSSRYFHENFLTAGFDYRIDPRWMLTGSVLDSHLLSSSDDLSRTPAGTYTFRQTYIAVGVRFAVSEK